MFTKWYTTRNKWQTSPDFGWPCSNVLLIFLVFYWMKHIHTSCVQTLSPTVFDTGFGCSKGFKQIPTRYLDHILPDIFPKNPSKLPNTDTWSTLHPAVPQQPSGPVLPKQPTSPSSPEASAGSSSTGHLDLEGLWSTPLTEPKKA